MTDIKKALETINLLCYAVKDEGDYRLYEVGKSALNILQKELKNISTLQHQHTALTLLLDLPSDSTWDDIHVKIVKLYREIDNLKAQLSKTQKI